MMSEFLGRKRSELFALCRDAGVKTTVSDTSEDLIAKLSGEPPPPRKQPDKPMIPEGKLMTLEGHKINGKKFRVTVFATEQDKADVAMAINGYAIKIQRNKEVILDECWVENLRNSMITTVEQDPETGAMMPITRLTYPHQAIAV